MLGGGMSRVSTVKHTRSRGTVHGRLWRVLRAPLPVMSTKDEAGVSGRAAVFAFWSQGHCCTACLSAQGVVPRPFGALGHSIDDVGFLWQSSVWAAPGGRTPPRVSGWCGKTSPITPVAGRQPEPCGVLSFASGQRPAPLHPLLRHYGRAMRGRASLFASF